MCGPAGTPGDRPAADAALAMLDITAYARSRSTVLPESRRGASRMSPYIRHGLVSLPEVWDAVADSPPSDRRRYRDELLWQEFARHLYARLPTGMADPLRYLPPSPPVPPDWDEEMACTSWVRDELEDHGWLVNQTRMWWASHWTVRHGRDWREGEDDFFRHLLDGSRAANRLGWQWTVGTGTGKPYGFSRWQVEKRAPQLCRSCPLEADCPIQDWPEASRGPAAPSAPPTGRSADPTQPDQRLPSSAPNRRWSGSRPSRWGTVTLRWPRTRTCPWSSSSTNRCCARLRLSGKRLVFLAECLADLAGRREVDVRLGRVTDELSGTPLATTFAPVPGFARHVGVPDDRRPPSLAVARPAHRPATHLLQRLAQGRDSPSAVRTAVCSGVGAPSRPRCAEPP